MLYKVTIDDSDHKDETKFWTHKNQPEDAAFEACERLRPRLGTIVTVWESDGSQKDKYVIVKKYKLFPHLKET